MTTPVYGAPSTDGLVTTGDYVPAKADASSLLDGFREAAKPEIYVEVTYPIEHRGPEMYATFLAVVGLDDVKKYRKSAMGNKKKAEDMDMIIANGMVLIEKNLRIYRGGLDEKFVVMDEDDEPLTFRSHEFLELYVDRTSAVDALRKFLGDAQLMNMGEKLYGAAGYGQDLEPVDPTNA